MTRMKKFINVFLISITIFVGVFIVLKFSQSNYSKEYNICSEYQTIEQSENFNKNNNVSTYVLQSSSTSYYCSKDTNVIITEDQGGEGLCWDFSTLKSLEILYTAKYHEVFDFSEAWIALCTKMEDSSYVIGGGERDIVKNSFWSSTKISFQQKILSLIDKYGIVMESDMPYEVIYHIDDTNYKDYYNLYSQYKVKLPYPAKVTSVFANYNESTSWERFWGTYNKQERMNNIKDFIVSNGSVMARINMPNEPILINNKVVVYDSNNSNYSNHAIAIVGWDDNFSVPLTNGSSISGAWIALNSYGSSFGEDGLFYIMYDDMIVCDNIYGFEISDDSRNLNITNIVSTATFTNKESNVMNSSSYVKNASCEVKNIFKPRSNKQVFYFYNANQDYSNYSLQIRIEYKHRLVDKFTVKSSPFEIKNSELSNYGSYSIIFEYDKESDGVIDEKYCHQITIWTGIDLGSVVTNLEKDNNDRYYQLYSNYHNKENRIFVYTYQNSACVTFYFNSYSNLMLVNYDKTIINYYYDEMVYSNNYSYASGRYSVKFDNLTTKGKIYEYSIKFISIDGIAETYNIIVFRMMDDQTIAYFDYCDTDVKINELNYKIFPVSAYTNLKLYYNYKDGYYMTNLKDSKGNFYYGNIEDGYTLNVSKMNRTNCEKNYYSYSNYTNSYFYTCILYSNFVVDDFKYENNMQVITLYGWESEHDIPTASGGSGSFSYSLVEPVENGVKLLNDKKFQFSALKAGVFTVNFCAKDNIRKQQKYCYVKFNVSPRKIQIFIDNKNSCYGDDIETLTYSIISKDIINNDIVNINLETTATKTSSVGTYDIIANVDNKNYEIVCNEAKYEIRQKHISLKKDFYEIEYTGEFQCPNLEFNNVIGEVEYNLIKQCEIGEYNGNVELVGDSVKNYVLENNFVNFSITKATPKYIIPFFDNITIDDYKTLADISLSKNYTWETPNQTLHYGSNICRITYTPEDLEHYKIITFETVIFVKEPISAFVITCFIIGAIFISMEIALIIIKKKKIKIK